MDERTKRAEELMEERLRARDDDAVTPGDDLRDKLDQATRDLQRERADFANYRRRNEAERADFARFAKTELIRRLLDVLDDFDRALEHVPADMREQPWVEGMWLVERKLRDILASEGLEEIGSVGKPFDPYIHEAIGHVDSDAPEGTVVDEVRKAYKLHDRVIRPALVTVARGVVPRGAQTEAPRPPGAQTEARSDEVEHLGRASGFAASEVGMSDEVEHPGPERGVPPSEGRKEGAKTMLKTKLATAAVAGVLSLAVTGAAAFAAFPPGTATAIVAATETGGTTPLQAEREKKDGIREILERLVQNGTITQAQAEAILKAFKEAGERKDKDSAQDREAAAFLKRLLGGMLQLSTEYIGLPKEAIAGQLRGAGKSLGEIADTQPGKSRDGLIAHLITAINAQLDKAVTEGKIKKERADEVRSHLTERVTKFVDHKYERKPAQPKERKTDKSELKKPASPAKPTT